MCDKAMQLRMDMIQGNKINKEGALKIIDGFRNIDAVLNILDFKDAFYDPNIQQLIKERDNARSAKNWHLADKIREQLKALGVAVKDRKINE